MRTSGVILVACLNIGTPPPDIIKPSNSARLECWFDPLLLGKEKGLEKIGNLLQIQYEKYQSKAKYKVCLDPLSDDLRRNCINMRKLVKNDRLLFHYNGHGVPRPVSSIIILSLSSLFLALSLSIYLSVYLSICLSIYLFISSLSFFPLSYTHSLTRTYLFGV